MSNHLHRGGPVADLNSLASGGQRGPRIAYPWPRTGARRARVSSPARSARLRSSTSRVEQKQVRADTSRKSSHRLPPEFVNQRALIFVLCLPIIFQFTAGLGLSSFLGFRSSDSARCRWMQKQTRQITRTPTASHASPLSRTPAPRDRPCRRLDQSPAATIAPSGYGIPSRPTSGNCVRPGSTSSPRRPTGSDSRQPCAPGIDPEETGWVRRWGVGNDRCRAAPRGDGKTL